MIRAAYSVLRMPFIGLLVVSVVALAAAYQTRRPITLDMASAGEEIYLLRGFYAPEAAFGVTYRWTDGNARVRLPGLGGGAPLRLHLNLHEFRPPPLTSGRVTIRLNEREIARFTPGAVLAAYAFDIPAGAIDVRGDAVIDLQSDTFTPSQSNVEGSTDERSLGLFVDQVSIEYGPGIIVPPLVVWALLTIGVMAVYGFVRVMGWGVRAGLAAGLLLLAAEIVGVGMARTWTAHNSPWLTGTAVSLYLIALRLKRSEHAKRVPTLRLRSGQASNLHAKRPISTRSVQFLQTTLKFIFPVFAFWRLALVVIPIAGSSVVGVPECCPQVDPEPVTSLSQAAFGHWYRWDAIWYGSVARDGYQYAGTREASNVAFFPLFPLASGLAARLTGFPVEVAGPLVSTLLAFAACLLLYRLAYRETGEPEAAERSVIYLLAFPAAYYLAIGYSEALYLLCVLAAFGWAREGKWGWCGAAAFLAGLARLHGALLIVPLGYEYLRQRGGSLPAVLNHGSTQRAEKNSVREASVPAWLMKPLAHLRQAGLAIRADAIGVLGAPLGVLAFMGYLGLQFRQPLAYFEVQALFFRGIRAEAFPTFPGTTLATFLHGALTNPPSTEGVIVVAATVLLLILTLEVWARLPRVYGVYMLTVALFSLTSGDLISMPRFVVPMFPGFVALAEGIGRRRWADRAILIVSVALQGVLALMFANGYWIA